MASPVRSLRKALGLSWADRVLLAETLVRLGLVRLTLRTLPARAVLSRLGAPQVETPRDDDQAAADLIRRVRWAVAAASRRAPWRCKCLEQAITAKLILRSRGVPTTLYLGIAKETTLQAHAWLRCGSRIVTGGAGVSRFVTVGSFGDRR
jgi:hypothetical protein